MAQITYFFLSKCIYCSKADRMIRLVKEKHPEFKAIKIQKIEESLKPEIAEQYDYQSEIKRFLKVLRQKKRSAKLFRKR